MLHTTYEPPPTREVGATQRLIAAGLTALGFVAAALGLWLAVGPEEGSLRVLWWTGTNADVAVWVAPMLLIGGGVLMAGFMAIQGVIDRGAGHRGAAAFEVVLGLVGLAAIAFGLFLVF